MANIIHKPRKDVYNNYIIEADTIEDAMDAIAEMMPRIRKKSHAFYKASIKDALERKGVAIIDRYAGNGTFYTIKLITQK